MSNRPRERGADERPSRSRVNSNNQKPKRASDEEDAWYEERARNRKKRSSDDRRASRENSNDRRGSQEGLGRRNRNPQMKDSRQRDEEEKWSSGKKAGVIALAVLLALLLGAIAVFAHYLTRFRDEVLTEAFTPEQVSIASEHHDLQFDETLFLNVAVFGDDSRGGEDSRTDTIMIASLNLDTNEVRLVSVFRDTLLELDDGTLDKAAHAHAFGGSQGAVSMLNRNLDLNIQHYVTVDFTATALVVNSLGGIEIDVTYGEIEYINGLSFQMVVEGEFDPNAGFVVPNEIFSPGLNHLCGIQALAYMRIRTVGNNDFRRAERQREVIEIVMRDAQRASLGTINDIINHTFDHLSTNFSLTEVLAYGRDINQYQLGETAGFPFDLTTKLLPRSGDSVIPTTLESNVIQLHYFLFGTENYVPSSTVMEISNNISHLTGTTEDSAIDIDGEWEFIPPPPDIPWFDENEGFDPVDPEQPGEPEAPVEPEEPGEPEIPVDPVDPGEPDVPVEPEPPPEG